MRVRDVMMANDDPDAVAEITPWEKAETISETKTEYLPDGALMPPYHFGCRTTPVMAREVTERNSVTDTEIGKSPRAKG